MLSSIKHVLKFKILWVTAGLPQKCRKVRDIPENCQKLGNFLAEMRMKNIILISEVQCAESRTVNCHTNFH